MKEPHLVHVRSSLPSLQPSMLVAVAAIALVVGLLPQFADARPGVGGRPGGGGGRPGGGVSHHPAAGGMARPAGGMSHHAGGMARPQMPAARPQMPATKPQTPGGLARPGGMQRPATSRPSLAGGSLPNLSGGGRPAPPPGGLTRPAPAPGLKPGGSAARPGLGSMRPQPGIAAKPSPAPGLSRPGSGPERPAPGRPTTLPGQIAGGRPGSGGNRPITPPGDIVSRPIIGGNRPSIGGDRPGIGDGNNVWNSGNWGSGNWGNNNNNFNNINVGGGWGLPGYGSGNWGYGGWANRWNDGCVNPHYGGWYNGCWGGNWGYNGGWWAPFAVGAATWGLASTIGSWGWGYGGAGYVNPYYAAVPAAVVASSPYDYSQPVVVNNYVTNDGDLTDAGTVQGATVTNEAAPSDRVFDAALAAFRAGDYTTALAGCDDAVKRAPNDSVIHEVRALSLFALGRYPEAAATLNAVLAVAPGMDWTTMSGLYGSVDAYTQQLRKLENFCRADPDSAAGHFVLAYHYLVGGHAEMAADALRVVVAEQPGDVVAKRLLDALAPPEQAAPAAAPAPPRPEPTRAPADATPSGPETDLVGTWTATSGKDTVSLSITDDSRFIWKAAPAGRPPVEISGTIKTAHDAIALVSEAAGTMSGKVASKGTDAFDFSLAGAPADASPIAFRRKP